MALSYNVYAGDDATTNFTFTPSYINQSDVLVYLDGVLQTLTTHYIWFNATTIQFVAAPVLDAVILLKRITLNTSRHVDFQDAGNLTEADLDLSANQMFYLLQEDADAVEDLLMKLDAGLTYWDAMTKVISNVVDPVADQDAATKKYGDDNWGGAAATAAAASAADAAADVVLTNADVVLTNADVVLTNADVVTTTALLDSFDDRYLGSKASAPTLDNDGDALAVGALYWNSTTSDLWFWLGAAWEVTLSATEVAALYQPLDDQLSDIAVLAPTKGRLIVGDGSNWVDVGVGADNEIVTADAAEAAGIKWAVPAPAGLAYIGSYDTIGLDTLMEYTTIPSTTRRIRLVFSDLSLNSSATYPTINIGDSTGYCVIEEGGTNYSSSTNQWSAGSGKAEIYATTPSSTHAYAGVVELTRLGTENRWLLNGISHEFAGYVSTICGYLDNGAQAVDRIKMSMGTEAYDYDGTSRVSLYMD